MKTAMKLGQAFLLVTTALALFGCSAPASDDDAFGVDNAEWKRKKKDAGAPGADAGAGVEASSPTSSSALPEPSCGGSTVTTTTGADAFYYIERNAHREVATLGAGQTGTASFTFQSYPCYATYGQLHYGNWQIVDGNGATISTQVGARQDFQQVVLPVHINAWGVSEGDYYPSGICAAEASVKNLTYETSGTSCESAYPVRSLFATYNGAPPAAVLGANVAAGTTMKFSARARFFDNYTASSCARVYLNGRNSQVTLSPGATEADLVELEAPVQVIGIPTCVSSPRQQKEDATADFTVEFSRIAYGPAN